MSAEFIFAVEAYTFLHAKELAADDMGFTKFVNDTNARIEYFRRYVLKLKELPETNVPGGGEVLPENPGNGDSEGSENTEGSDNTGGNTGSGSAGGGSGTGDGSTGSGGGNKPGGGSGNGTPIQPGPGGDDPGPLRLFNHKFLELTRRRISGNWWNWWWNEIIEKPCWRWLAGLFGAGADRCADEQRDDGHGD